MTLFIFSNLKKKFVSLPLAKTDVRPIEMKMIATAKDIFDCWKSKSFLCLAWVVRGGETETKFAGKWALWKRLSACILSSSTLAAYLILSWKKYKSKLDKKRFKITVPRLGLIEAFSSRKCDSRRYIPWSPWWHTLKFMMAYLEVYDCIRWSRWWHTFKKKKRYKKKLLKS